MTRREPHFLVPALELLEAERARFLAVAAAYGQARRLQKVAGLRFPPRDHATPTSPRRWWGDEAVGALVTLQVGRGLAPLPQHGLADDRLSLVTQCVSSVLASDDLPVSLAALDDTLAWARSQIHVIGWEADRLAYQQAMQILWILGQLHLLLRGPAPLGAPWRFVH